MGQVLAITLILAVFTLFMLFLYTPIFLSL